MPATVICRCAGASRKPFNWSTASSPRWSRSRRRWSIAATAWRALTNIFTHDVELFGGILPRMLAGCPLGAFISEMLPQDKVSRALGPNPGFRAF